MEFRKLGKDGPQVSALGLGCMGMSYAYGPVDEEESLQVFHRYLELRGNFLDTAEVYGPYKNEELLGRFLREVPRDSVVVATKFGFRINSDGIRGVDSSPENVRRACDASLGRLGIETIDLYYQHRVDPNVPIEETVGAMAELVRQGKVRFLGLSEAAADTLRRAHKIHPIAALQSEYSLWTRDPEDQILPTIRELGIALVAYSPLGRGFLTGQIKRVGDFEPEDYPRQSPRFVGENFQKNLDLVARVEAIAKERNCTPSQLALAWLLAQGDDIIPIPGTKRRKYLEENVVALQVSLTRNDLSRIDEVAPHGAASGDRYPAHMMAAVNR